MNKTKMLKILLRISAAIQMFWWGFSHIFYPKWYHDIVGVKGIDFRRGFSAVATNQIGILTLGTAVATWLCVFDPIRNKAIIQMLYVVGVGGIGVFV